MSQSAKPVAIVTGAAEGIGRGIALRLAQDRLDLGLFDLPRAKARLKELAETLQKDYETNITTIVGDVSKEEDVKRLVETVVQEHGNLYAESLSTASYTRVRDVTSPTEELDKLLDINIKGTFFSYKYAAIQLIKQGTGGRIIGAASVASKRGLALHSVYSVTKFAIRGLTQSAAMDYGKYGITGNAYAPGAIETPLINQMDEYYSKTRGQPLGSYKKNFNNLLGRNGQPEDIAKLVSFLLSDDGGFITGQSYIVDGGTYFD